MVGLLPVHDAYADRSGQSVLLPPRVKAKAPARARPPAKTAPSVSAPSVAAPSAAALPFAALSLGGTYKLSTIAMRPVRDTELAQSTITFAPNGQVSVQTACNKLGATLQSRSKPGEILGFSNPAMTLLPCQPRANQAQLTTAGLLGQTANIARAGNSVTLFDVNGINIAQWTAIINNEPQVSSTEASSPQASAPQHSLTSAVPSDVRHYILTELGDNLIAAPTVSNRPPSLPTFVLRASGIVMGNSGCNQYQSELIENRDQTQRFGPVVSTKMACLDRDTSRVEVAFLNAMRTANRVTIQDGYVEFFGPNGERIAQLRAINSPLPDRTNLRGAK